MTWSKVFLTSASYGNNRWVLRRDGSCSQPVSSRGPLTGPYRRRSSFFASFFFACIVYPTGPFSLYFSQHYDTLKIKQFFSITQVRQKMFKFVFIRRTSILKYYYAVLHRSSSIIYPTIFYYKWSDYLVIVTSVPINKLISK